MTIEDLLFEISDFPPVDGQRAAAIDSAAAKLSIDRTTAYRWIKSGMRSARFEHVSALCQAVNAVRLRAGRPLLTLTDVVEIEGATDATRAL